MLATLGTPHASTAICGSPIRMEHQHSEPARSSGYTGLIYIDRD